MYPWMFGTLFCRFKIFLSELCPLVSILLLTLFSAERYLTICHPFRKTLRFSQNDTGHMRSRGHIIQTTITPKLVKNAEDLNKLITNVNYVSIKKHNSLNINYKNHQHMMIPSSINSNQTFINDFRPISYSSSINHPPRTCTLRKTPHSNLQNLKACFLIIFIVWIVAAIFAAPIAGLSKAFFSVYTPTTDEILNITCKNYQCLSNTINQSLITKCIINSKLWTVREVLPDSLVCAVCKVRILIIF